MVAVVEHLISVEVHTPSAIGWWWLGEVGEVLLPTQLREGLAAILRVGTVPRELDHIFPLLEEHRQLEELQLT